MKRVELTSWLLVAVIASNAVLGPVAAAKAHHPRKAGDSIDSTEAKKLVSFNRGDYELLDSNNVEAGSEGASNNNGAMGSTGNKANGSTGMTFNKGSQLPAQQKQDSPFSWRNIITMALQFAYKLLNPNNGLDKSGDGPILQDGEFSWTRLVSLVVKIALAGLGADPSGLDRSDQGGPVTPMESMLTAALSILMSSSDPKEVTVMAKQAGELINLGVSLLDALKTSFSRRSLQARSMGDSDRWSDAAVASLSLLKGYVQTYKSDDEACQQKAMCLANRACSVDAPSVNDIWCKIASYMMSMGVQTRSKNNSEMSVFTEAARRGRLLEDCDVLYMCNEVY